MYEQPDRSYQFPYLRLKKERKKKTKLKPCLYLANRKTCAHVSNYV